MKTDLILTAFGTARPEGLKTFELVRKRFHTKYPQWNIQWAFTSSMIRTRLNGTVLSPEECVAAVAHDAQQIIVQPFQIVPGAEYERMVASIQTIPVPCDLTIGEPLIANKKMISPVIDLVLSPYQNSSSGILVVGHGNGNHPSDRIYHHIRDYLHQKFDIITCATLEATPTFEEAMAFFSEKGVTKITMVPLLFVAGKHVLVDIDGDGEFSWKTRASRRGFSVSVQSMGLGDREDVVHFWSTYLEKKLLQ